MSSVSFRILRRGSRDTERSWKERLRKKVKPNHNLFSNLCSDLGKMFHQSTSRLLKSGAEEAKAALDQIIKQRTWSQSESHCCHRDPNHKS